MPPGWPQYGPKRPREAPIWPQDDPKMAPRGPKRPHDSPKMAPRGPIWPMLFPRSTRNSKSYIETLAFQAECRTHRNLQGFGTHSGARTAPGWPQDGLKMAPRWSQDGPKMAPRWPRDGPKMAQYGPRWPQDNPKSSQDGHQRPPRGVPNRSQIGLPRFSNIEAEKVSAPANVKCHFGPFWGPSWGPCWAYVGPREGL